MDYLYSILFWREQPLKGMEVTFEPLLTVKEVAEILKVRPETVRNEISGA